MIEEKITTLRMHMCECVCVCLIHKTLTTLSKTAPTILVIQLPYIACGWILSNVDRVAATEVWH